MGVVEKEMLGVMLGVKIARVTIHFHFIEEKALSATFKMSTLVFQNVFMFLGAFLMGRPTHISKCIY